MMYAYLIHLSANMWRKKGQKSANIKDEEDAIYHEEMCCDRETWRKITDFLPECGINTLLIDVGDGIQFDRHPEISIPGAWSKEELKAELARLRAMGITPLPKCNFSAGHNGWLKEYAYMIGTDLHLEICKDVIEEVIEVFDTPAFFHLGLEEEDAKNQTNQPVSMIRAPYKKLEDANYLFDVCRAKGVRPWIWACKADVEAFGGEEAFRAGIGKDVLLSGWHYTAINNCPDPTKGCPMAEYYVKFGEWGYEQVPTSSTWSWHLNSKQTMFFCKNNVAEGSIVGYMTAPWHLTVPKKLYAHMNDAFTFGNAKKDIYGE